MGNLRWRKLLAAAVAVVVILAGLAVVGISYKVSWGLTHPEREPVVLKAAAEKLHIKPVTFPSRQGGITLKGWFMAGESDKTVIFVHGYGKNRLQEDVPGLDVAKGLVGQGYNVLLFDLRGSGESGGAMVTVGQYEKEDVLGAVDFIHGMGRPGRHIGVMGFSMGAVAALLAAAEEPRIEAVAADAPFADLRLYLSANLPIWSNLPDFPFTPVTLSLMPAFLGLDPEKVSPIAVVGRIKAPILFIHGRSDNIVPLSNSQALAKRASGSRLWVVPGAGHVGSFDRQPREYMSRILDLYGHMK